MAHNRIYIKEKIPILSGLKILIRLGENMKTLQEILDGYKSGTITLEDAKKWNQDLYDKLSKEAQEKAEKKFDNPEVRAKLEKIEQLEKDALLLSKESETRKDLEKLIERMKKEYDTDKEHLKNENERTKTLLEKKETAYINKVLKEKAVKILQDLGVSNSNYAADDLIRDGKLKMSKYQTESGEDDYKIETDFQYLDDVTKKMIKSNFAGTETNIDEIKKGLTILTSGETDYTRIKDLYPVTKNIGNGSGFKGNSGTPGKEMTREERYNKMP